MWDRAAAFVLQRHHRTFPSSVERVDLALYRKIAGLHNPVLEATLPRLSRAANRSRLWLGIALLLGRFGGPRGRAAARRGVAAVALTSIAVNGPIKLLARRKRPVLEPAPVLKRLLRAPLSSSFPSGHTASAAAFATATLKEMPAAGVPIAALAGAVGLSRVYVGVHYPADVVVGAALGFLAGANADRLFPQRTHDEVAAIEREQARAPQALAVVVNPGAGNPLQRNAKEAIAEELPGARVSDAEDPLEGLRAAADGADAVGVAGGDGSVSAAATVAVETGLPLAVFPTGTLNHFARALGMDDVSDGIEAVRSGTIARVDAGRIDGRVFLNTASFGAYAELVDARERLERLVGKWPAALLGLARVLWTAPPVEVELDGERCSVWAIFIGNCGYEPRGLAPSTRPRLDDGMFDVRLLRAEGRWARARALLAMATGDLTRTAEYRERRVRTLRVRALDGPLRLAADGETFDGSGEFVVQKVEEGVRVFVPPS